VAGSNARRKANSLSREVARASIRLATLAQPISSNNPTAARIVYNVDSNRPINRVSQRRNRNLEVRGIVCRIDFSPDGLAVTVKSAPACDFEVPVSVAHQKPAHRQSRKPVGAPGTGVSGIYTSASYQPKRGGMIPTRVREVPFSTKVLFSTASFAVETLHPGLMPHHEYGAAPDR